MESELKQQLIEAAILAPSADNSQPWLYRWNDETLELWIDNSRSGGISDQRFVLSDLAIGCCIENITICAHSHNHTCQATYLPSPDKEPLWAASLTFLPTPAQHAPLAASIPKRHTSRSFPWKGPITATTKQTLSNEAKKQEGITLHWLDDTPRYKTALKAMWLAESLRFSTKELHQELFSSIHFDLDSHSTSQEGLAPATLSIEPPMRPLFKLLRHWKIMRLLNCVGGNYLVGFRSTVLPTLLSPALALLTIKQTDRASIIMAGQALQRVWLNATTHNLSLQPFAAAGIFSLGFIQTPAALPPRCQKIGTLMQAISGHHQGLILLRTGITTHRSKTIYNQRRPIDSFLKTSTHCQDFLQPRQKPTQQEMSPTKNIK